MILSYLVASFRKLMFLSWYSMLQRMRNVSFFGQIFSEP